MASFDRTLPPTLAALARLPLVDEDEDPDDAAYEAVDFERYAEFQAAADNQAWIRAWTRNEGLTGEEFRFFGQDRSGGKVGLWLVRPGAALVDQPVVFFGSEGEVMVLAVDVGEFLWLLAAGFGPRDVAGASTRFDRAEHPRLAAFAAASAGEPRRSAQAVLQRAREAFPRFAADVRALCRG